jgi:ABC-2 type transport system ATP-binding protein
MDPQSAKLVRDALIELQRDKRTIMLTTHNLTEAQALADRIAVIRRGRIIALGTFTELSRRFVGDPVMEIQFTQPLNGVAKDLAAIVDVVESGEYSLRYRTGDPRETNPAVIRKLSAHGVDVVTLSEVKQSLEDVYLQIVAEDEQAEVSKTDGNKNRR